MKVKLINYLENDWKNILSQELGPSYFEQMQERWEEAALNEIVYPPVNQVFTALNLCPPKDCNVIILGQDPYHGPNQAHGLAFSVPAGLALPPSLKNIFKELQRDYPLALHQSHGDLTPWAEQGVLLLNEVLTVSEGQPGSHRDWQWQLLTINVLEYLNSERQGLVFHFWGKAAQAHAHRIDAQKHLVLLANHPSPLSANRGGWFGKSFFSQTNAYLESQGKAPIRWF